MLPECARCGATMALNDETTKLLEFRCPNCHDKRIESKSRRSNLAEP